MNIADKNKRELLIEVARLYYYDNLKQQEIADRLKIPRSSISRILSKAHKEGMVEIIIHCVPSKPPILRENIKTRFNLKGAKKKNKFLNELYIIGHFL